MLCMAKRTTFKAPPRCRFLAGPGADAYAQRHGLGLNDGESLVTGMLLAHNIADRPLGRIGLSSVHQRTCLSAQTWRSTGMQSTQPSAPSFFQLTHLLQTPSARSASISMGELPLVRSGSSLG